MTKEISQTIERKVNRTTMYGSLFSQPYGYV